MDLRSLCQNLALLASLVSLVASAPFEIKTDALTTRGANCNTPNNRSCWLPGFGILTDYDVFTPSTRVTRQYTLTVTEIDRWVGPDGNVKTGAMLVNNQFPGPVISADWGDQISVTVFNKLKYNGTSIHWHGLRQLNSNVYDGTNGLTECPIPPGQSKTYTFTATQYGTSWYHSHTSSQYANGVLGSVVINGPASCNYDIDLGVLPISDYYYDSADHLFTRVNDPTNPFIPGRPGSPPSSNNILINGTNINPNGVGGVYANITLTPGKVHRLRLINPSVDNSFTVSIAGHQLTVIETDLVPVKPSTTSSLFMGIGQRYDVLINANQTIGNYWLNVTLSGTKACGTSNNPYPAAIVTYRGATPGKPTNQGTSPPESLCQDQTFTPIIPRNVSAFKPLPSSTLDVTTDSQSEVRKVVFWKVNGSAMNVIWEKPSLEFVAQGNLSFPRSENVITVPDSTVWSYWLVQNESPTPHPMHLHGHDFVIMGRSSPPTDPLNNPVTTTFDPARDNLQLVNPPRRDSTMLPGGGWLVVAFRNDNPGAWLFHCHIAWHVAQGLSVQFLEKVSQIPKTMDLRTVQPGCDAWRAYAPTDPDPKIDSGI